MSVSVPRMQDALDTYSFTMFFLLQSLLLTARDHRRQWTVNKCVEIVECHCRAIFDAHVGYTEVIVGILRTGASFTFGVSHATSHVCHVHTLNFDEWCHHIPVACNEPHRQRVDDLTRMGQAIYCTCAFQMPGNFA